MKLIKVIITLAILKQILWLIFIPIWHFPDEQAHFAQAQNIAEKNPNIIYKQKDTSEEIAITEELLGTKRDGFGNNKFTYHTEYNINYSTTKYGIFEEQINTIPRFLRTQYSLKESTGYPPVYYQIAAIFYNFGYHQGIIDRIFLVRVFNLLLYIIFCILVYQISKLVFTKDIYLTYSSTILVIFHPMLSYVFAGINSDNLFNTISILIMFLCLKLILEKANLKLIILIIISSLLAIKVKPQGIILVSFFLYPLLINFIKNKNLRKTYFLGIILTLLICCGNIVLNIVRGYQILPDLPALTGIKDFTISGFVTFLKNTIIHTYREVIPWYWGIFRWLSLTYPRYIHRPINWISLISIIGLIIYYLKNFKNKIKQKTIINFFVFSSLIYFIALVIFDYIFSISHGFSFGIQGRYYFPTIIAHMFLILFGFITFGKIIRINKFIPRSLAVTMILFSYYTIVFVSTSYYNLKSIQSFFIEASQYKPSIIKSPVLEIFVILNLIVFIFFLIHFFRYKNNKDSI